MDRNGEFFPPSHPPSSRLTVWTPPTCGPWAALAALVHHYGPNTKPQTWRNGGGSIMVAGGGLDEGTPLGCAEVPAHVLVRQCE